MFKYKKKVQKLNIADLKILLTTYFETTSAHARQYEDDSWEEREADEKVFLTERGYDIGLENYTKKYRSYVDMSDEEFEKLTLDKVEYDLTGALFNRIILMHNGIMLHSSAVVVDGYAYLFSADSGTGKSTHTNLWLKHFGDGAYILNDDKPAIRMVDGEWKVYGTPWSGKTDTSRNVGVKLGGIVFLERSEDNWIDEIKPNQAVKLFFAQTVRRIEKEENMDIILSRIEKILTSVPIYKMGCNISDEAVQVAYNKIRRV